MDSSPHPAGSAAARRAARLATPRLRRELETIAAMLRIYCADHHAEAVRDEAGLCADCASLRDYAGKRLAGCPYAADKPTCVNCRIHCYGPRQREAMRVVMRYAGPRMMWRHPWLALAHIADGRRPAPPRPNARSAAPGEPDRPPAPPD